MRRSLAGLLAAAVAVPLVRRWNRRIQVAGPGKVGREEGYSYRYATRRR